MSEVLIAIIAIVMRSSIRVKPFACVKSMPAPYILWKASAVMLGTICDSAAADIGYHNLTATAAGIIFQLQRAADGIGRHSPACKSQLVIHKI